MDSEIPEKCDLCFEYTESLNRSENIETHEVEWICDECLKFVTT